MRPMPRRPGSARPATPSRREALDALGPDGKAVVLVGKAHNIHDRGTEHEHLPASCGAWADAQTIPSDLAGVPFHSPDVGEARRSMTLAMGQRTLAAADIIRRDARLNAIYLANFGCVNDSMYPRFFGRETGEKPFPAA